MDPEFFPVTLLILKVMLVGTLLALLVGLEGSYMKYVLTTFATLGLLCAQEPNPTQRPAGARDQVITLDKQPLYKVTVVSRSATAINYRHRSGATKVNFRGTALMPKARAEAKVESKQGYIEIEVEFDDLSPATQFGPEYLTYVLWAISPEGRAVNLGEVLLNGTKSKLDVSSDLQAFGMIVTAEPYFSVTQPSDVVVMENYVRPDTKGQFEVIDAKYELLQRGQYTFNVDRSRVRAVNTTDKSVPIELYEAQNAVQIAQWAGADKYATDSYQKAVGLLKQAEDYQMRKQKKSVSMVAREAVQTAEDARVIALRREEQERLEKERQASADRENAAQQQAAEAARQRAQAEEQQRLEAERRRQAELQQQLASQQALQAQQQAAQSAEQARLESQRRAEAEQAAQRAESERAAADRAKAEALAAQQEASRQKAEADAARTAALQQQQIAQQEAERARTAAAEADRMRMKAETDKEALRQQLLQQFNSILQTRDTARGLIVNMSDVLFDTAKYTLRPGAREKLARVSGIILSHPGLRIEVEGHTDSVGGEAYNQTLSENRANAVRQYLISSGIDPNNVTAKGFGKTMPVASNDTAAGRQQNRRVELVVSGEVIGTKLTEIHTMGTRPVTNPNGTATPPQH